MTVKQTLKDYCESNGLEYILKEWDYAKNAPLTPDNVTFQSNKKVSWRCEKGHEWESTVNNRIGKLSGCPYCAGKKAIAGYNDLATIRPDLAAEWHPTLNGELTPSMVMQGSATKVWWLCPKGHAYQASLNSRTNRKSGCPYCSGNKVLPGYNDLATKFPAIAKQWHPTLNGDLTPDQVTPGSNKRVWWVCGEGHVWDAVINNRTRKGYGCPVCAGLAKKHKHSK